MTVKLVGYKRSYIGLSSDTKPVTTSAETIPEGSTFFETDTGRTATWDGFRWTMPPLDLSIIDRLDEIVAELREIKELHTAMAAEM